MKKSFVLLLAGIISISAYAQKNKIEIGAGGYKFYNVTAQLDDAINTVDIRYTREIKKNLALYGQYTRLPFSGWLLAEMEPVMAKESVGKLTSHNKFNYWDLGVQYKFIQYKQHSISGFGGISVAYGENSYLTRVIWTEPENDEPYGHPILAEYEDKKESYLGGVLGIRYDYTFWKNKINISPSFSVRSYTNNFPFQINYGIHLGYNF